MSNKNDEAFVVGVKPHWWSRRRFEVEGIRFRSRETANKVLDNVRSHHLAFANEMTGVKQNHEAVLSELVDAHDELSAGHVGALAEAADKVVSLTDEARLLKGRLVAADRAVMAGRAECAVVGECLAASRRLVEHEQDQHAQTQNESEYFNGQYKSALESLEEAREEAVRAGKRAEDREEAFNLAQANIDGLIAIAEGHRDINRSLDHVVEMSGDLNRRARLLREKESVGALIPDGDGFRTAGGVRVVVGGQPLWRITGGDGVEVKVKDTGEAIRLLSAETER